MTLRNKVDNTAKNGGIITDPTDIEILTNSHIPALTNGLNVLYNKSMNIRKETDTKETKSIADKMSEKLNGVSF